MSELLRNAIASIQLGVEDHQSNDPRRPLSAARNLYSGILLLAKHALIQAAPDGDVDALIAAKVRPVPNGVGGFTFEPDGRQTIDATNLTKRLKDFGIHIDHGALDSLGRLRNDIEHKFTHLSGTAAGELIARAFPIVGDLCRQIGTTPATALGETWAVMIAVKEVFEVEEAKCVATFSAVEWADDLIRAIKLMCPSCGSALLMQEDPDNQTPENIKANCQVCDFNSDGESLIAHALDEHFGDLAYSAAMGEVSDPVHECPYCAVLSYVTARGNNVCVWCGHRMGKCDICEAELTPENVSWDEETRCNHCDYVLSKDD